MTATTSCHVDIDENVLAGMDQALDQEIQVTDVSQTYLQEQKSWPRHEVERASGYKPSALMFSWKAVA